MSFVNLEDIIGSPYEELIALIEHGLIKYEEKTFADVKPGGFFIASGGTLCKKQEFRFKKGTYGGHLIKSNSSKIIYFRPNLVVKELVWESAKAKRLRYQNLYSLWDLSSLKGKTRYPIFKLFRDLETGDHFKVSGESGIWTKINHIHFDKKLYNSTQCQGSKRTLTYVYSHTQVTHIKDEKVELVSNSKQEEPNFKIHVKPKERLLAIIKIKEFNVRFTLDGEEHVQKCSARLQVDDQDVLLTEKDTIEVQVRNRCLVITPIRCIYRGFYLKLEVKNQCDPVKIALRLGTSLEIFTQKIEKDEIL
jgi:hypothetical protein